MTVFSEKLRRIPSTIARVSDAVGEVDRLQAALRESSGRLSIAIGSGGSAVAAEYLARCRSTLGAGHTIVQTPMEFVLAAGNFSDCEIWLFSAGADNPDIKAALQAALLSSASSIRLITVRADGAAAATAKASDRCSVYVLPVEDPKDGFLATHSLTAMVSALLLASNGLAEVPDPDLKDTFYKEAERAISRSSVQLFSEQFQNLKLEDTIILLEDPQLRAIGVLIETSIWETGLCSIQRTDFRNFAHGRHVWIAKRPATTVVLALPTSESAAAWNAISALLPDKLRMPKVDQSGTGRLGVAVGIMRGLAIVEAIGIAVGIDPGRPGVGSFAKCIYEDASLNEISRRFSSSIRHKRDAVLLQGGGASSDLSICTVGQRKLSALADATFRGVVLDYDGTIVATEARLQPPSQQILDELVRLIDGGIAIGIATGRGGSAGEMLRERLPQRVHRLITVGYYNGGHIRTLDVDIALDRPEQNVDMHEVAAWIEQRGLLKAGRDVKRGPVQLMFNHTDLVDPQAFAASLAECPPVAQGRVRVQSSHHSFDIIPRTSSKVQVVQAVAASTGDHDASILGIGDSGSRAGNDYELLLASHGVSVDSVCGSPDGCWSLFGPALVGPAALLAILSSLEIGQTGGRLNMLSLNLNA